MTDHRLPFLRVRSADVAGRVLAVGDPERAEEAAALLDDGRELARHREYATFGGGFRGRRVTVVSHGIGAAGAGICFEELARAGARVVIRAGTCGAVRDGIDDGDLVIATGAVRDEGLTPRLLPVAYPALAHHRVIAALEAAADQAGVAAHSGVVLTSDLFYPSASLGQAWGIWKASRVAAVEMEASALFVVAALHGFEAGGLFTVDGNPTRGFGDMRDYDPHREVVRRGAGRMLRVALEALVSLEVED